MIAARVELSADDPRVLADLPASRKSQLLEQLDGRAKQEPILSLAAGGHFGGRLYEATTSGGDLRERALESGSCDPLSAMPLVDEDAGNPPARGWRRGLAYSRLCLSPSSSGLPYWHQPCVIPLSSNTSTACARPARTNCSFSVRGSLTPRWYAVWYAMHQHPP